MELWKVEQGLSLEIRMPFILEDESVDWSLCVYKAMEQAIRIWSVTAKHLCRVSHHSCSLTTWRRTLTNREIIKSFLLFLCCLGNVFFAVLLGEMCFLHIFLYCLGKCIFTSVLLGEMCFLLFLYCLGKCVFFSFCLADIVVVSHWGRLLHQSCNQAQCVSNLPTVDFWFSHLCKIQQGRYLLQAVLGCLSCVIHKAHVQAVLGCLSFLIHKAHMYCASCVGVSVLRILYSPHDVLCKLPWGVCPT